MFTDIEDVKLSQLPCGEELIKETKEKRTDDEIDYFVKGREIECEIAITEPQKERDGQFIVKGYFFDDKYVFDYRFNSFNVYVILPKDESANILSAVEKEEVYPALQNNSDERLKMALDGPMAFKQILKFTGKDVQRVTNGYGISAYFITAEKYELIKPDPKIHKQQHFGYNDFIFDGGVNTQEAPIPQEQAVETSTSTPVTNTPPTGQWQGDFGKDKLTINIESVNGTDVTGWDEVKGNRRNLTGTVESQNGSYSFKLKEPGDDKWDGVFEIKYVDGETTITGTWTANNGKSIKNFTLTKEH